MKLTADDVRRSFAWARSAWGERWKDRAGDVDGWLMILGDVSPQELTDALKLASETLEYPPVPAKVLGLIRKARAERSANGSPLNEEKAKRAQLVSFLERLASRARRSADGETERYAVLLAKRAAEFPLQPDELGWLRAWWELLEALDRSYFSGLYLVAMRGQDSSPLWRSGSALDYTEAEFRKRGDGIESFVQSKCDRMGRPRHGVTVETLVEAIA